MLYINSIVLTIEIKRWLNIKSEVWEPQVSKGHKIRAKLVMWNLVVVTLEVEVVESDWNLDTSKSEQFRYLDLVVNNDENVGDDVMWSIKSN